MCGIENCKGLAIMEVPIKFQDNLWAWVFVCWTHLRKARKCKNCVDYSEDKNECRNPAPYQTVKKEKGPKWALMGPEENCGQWRPKLPIPLEEIKEENGKDRDDVLRMGRKRVDRES